MDQTFEIPAPGVVPCVAPVWIGMDCAHGGRAVYGFGCGDIADCESCWLLWSRRVRQRIVDGIWAYPARYQFVTLTFPGANKAAEYAFRAWKKLRKHWHRKYGQLRYYRVAESHRRGGVHFHFVFEGSHFPLVKHPNKRETLKAYLSRQSPEQRAFIEEIQRYGFGPVTDVQQCYGSPHGIAAYLGKYLSKRSKMIVRANGRRARVAEGSRDWYPEGKKEKDYRYGVSARVSADSERVPECCATRDDPAEVRDSRRKRREKWLRSSPSYDSMERYYLRTKMVQRAQSKIQVECEREDPDPGRIAVLREWLARYQLWRDHAVKLIREQHYNGPLSIIIEEVRSERSDPHN